MTFHKLPVVLSRSTTTRRAQVIWLEWGGTLKRGTTALWVRISIFFRPAKGIAFSCTVLKIPSLFHVNVTCFTNQSGWLSVGKVSYQIRGHFFVTAQNWLPLIFQSHFLTDFPTNASSASHPTCQLAQEKYAHDMTDTFKVLSPPLLLPLLVEVCLHGNPQTGRETGGLRSVLLESNESSRPL